MRLRRKDARAGPPKAGRKGPERETLDFASWLSAYRTRLEDLLEDGKAAPARLKEKSHASCFH